MKKCLTGFILFVALLLLNIPISAAVQPAVIYATEANPVRAQVWNAQGDLVWVDVVNAQGGIDYLQTPAGWKRVYTMPTAQEVAQQATALKAQLESDNLRIQGEGDSPITAYHRLWDLKQTIDRIPESLYTAAQSKLAGLGKTLTIRLADALPANGAMGGSYAPSSTTMNLDMIGTHTHEYGHMVQLTLLSALYGADRLRSEWIALNGGAAMWREPSLPIMPPPPLRRTLRRAFPICSTAPQLSKIWHRSPPTAQRSRNFAIYSGC